MATPSDVRPPRAVRHVDWLRRALWADDVEVAWSTGDAGPLTFLTAPNAQQPELLVPTRPNRAAALIARRSSDARTVPARLRAAAIEMALWTGVGQRAARSRLLSVDVGDGHDDPDRSLPAWVGQRLGLDAVVVAVTIGPARYNRKPVVTVFTPAGELRAFVKLGVDPHTDRDIANEAHWLASIGGLAPTGFEVPPVLAVDRWRGHEVLVTAPVFPPRLPVRTRIDRPPAGLVDAIAGADPAEPSTVAASATVADARRIGDGRLAAAVDRVLEGHSETPLRVGLWHGDLTPWNIATRWSQPPLVWDWEAAAPARPIGADTLHSLVMVPTHLQGCRPAAAVAQLAPDDVGDGQQDDAARRATLAVYLLDIARRDLEMIEAGVDPSLLPGIGAAALDRLVRS